MSSTRVPGARKYSWTPPRFFEGETVRFLNHRGSLRVGVVSFVETRYGYANAKASHVYYMRVSKPPDPRGITCFHLWIGEENMLERVED